MLNKTGKLKAAMENATTYEQWKECAMELDHIENNVEWKERFVSDQYNYNLVYDRFSQLRTCHQQKNTCELVRSLREGLHHDLGNMGNPALYTRSRVGTKHLIEEYINQVCASLNYLCDESVEGFRDNEKLRFFQDTLLSFGRPALLLSGGATLGMFHIGVIKALWERGLLPRVIAGSSVGSLVAAMLGSYTDAELPEMLDPDHHNLSPWKWQGICKGITGQGFMSPDQLRSCLRSNIGELTFEESWKRTGRSVNITVSPTQDHQKARLLSRYTSPYLLMWSASQASCSVPGIFPPTTLMKKTKRGELTDYMPGLKWVDGSVVSDLPIERLMHLYDVNFSIVSQTNPHIVPFLQGSSKSGKKSLWSLPVRLLKAEAGFHGKVVFDFLRKSAGPEMLRQASGQMYAILAQKYIGDVTIAPEVSLQNYQKMLSNPSPEFVAKLTREGERATWPKIAMIRTHAKISQTLEKCILRIEGRLQVKKGELRVISSG
ncbi:MAG: patatin [Proteobacteria bacterium]|nr:MAG: patatin [Pseudomonadota bacterium]PIE40111.1 MAG: patatin [Gammaproteobacteria bacterium]